ncbi:MAG: translocation/assembly module TamB domain-containing protein, partial [Schleiferiaceae bacterium]
MAPSLAEKEISIDFSGFDYQFPSSFYFGPTTLNYGDSTLITVTNIELHDVFWSSQIDVRDILVNQCELHSPLDGERMKGFFNTFSSDSGDAGQSFQATIGAIYIDSIHGSTSNDISWTISGESGNVVLDDELSAEDVSLLAVLNGVQFEVESENISKSSEGQIKFDYLLTSSGIAKASGGVSGIVDSLYLEGSIQTDNSIELASMGLEEYEPVLQACEFSFNSSWYNSEFTGRVSGGNSSYSMRSTLTQEESDSYTISMDLDLSREFYNWSIFNDFEPVLGVFCPKNAKIGLKTDFSEFSWSTVLTDENNRWELSSESLNDPVRGMLLSNQLALGPIESAKAQMSVLPNLSAVIEGDDFEILAALPEIRSNGQKVKGLNARFEHRQDKDSLWLSSLDPNCDIELMYSRAGTLNTISGQLNTLDLGLVDPLDTGQRLTARANINFTDEGLGSVLLQDVILTRPEDVIFLRELSLTHVLGAKSRSLVLSSDVLDFSVNGNWDFKDFPKVASHVLQDIIVQKEEQWPQAAFKFDIQAGNVGWIADLIHLDVFISEDTHIFGKYNGMRKMWSTTMFIPEATYENNSGKDIVVASSQTQDVHNTTLKADKLKFDTWNFSKVNLSSNGSVGPKRIQFTGAVEDSIPSKINLEASLLSGEAEITTAAFNIGESHFTLLDTANLQWQNAQLNVDSLMLAGKDGRFVLNGQLFDTEAPEIELGLEDFNSKVVNYLFRTPAALFSGTWNAQLKLKDSFFRPFIQGQIEVADFGLNNYEYGRFTANAEIENLTHLNAFGQLRQGSSSSFSFSGDYDFTTHEIDVRASIDEFAVDPFNPLFNGVLDEFSGTLQGGLEWYGPLEAYTLNGAFTMSDGHFIVPIVGAELSAAEPIELVISEDEITLDTAKFYAPKDSTTAIVFGGIHHNQFDSLVFDLKLHSDSIRAVDLSRNIDGYFYGTAVVEGDLVLEGPLEQLHLDLAVATKDGTNFKIPLDNPTAVEMPSYIRFSDAGLPTADSVFVQELEYFTTDIAIEATPNADVELVLDEVLGDVIKARGSGNMRLKILEDESLELYGLYTLVSGDYLFTLQNIINKPFEIIPGGTILWSGDLYEAQVNIDAKYSLSTDLQGLVSNANYNNENVNVDLIINLSGALMNPDIAFTVDLPNAPASYLEELQRHFLSEDAMNYQAFSLLLLGEFYQQDLAVQEGFDFSGSVSRNTSELLVSEFGSWLAAGIGSYVDLELDYTSGTNPYEVLGT